MEGIELTTYEIFEIILSISILLTISVAIIYTSNPEIIKGNLFLTETNEISQIISTNTEIKIKIPKDLNSEKTKINIENNKLTLINKNKNILTKESLLKNIEIQKIGDEIIIKT